MDAGVCLVRSGSEAFQTLKVNLVGLAGDAVSK